MFFGLCKVIYSKIQFPITENISTAVYCFNFIFEKQSFQKSLFCSVLSINATVEKQPVPPLTKPTHLTTDCPFKDFSIQLDLLHSIECPFQRTGDYLWKIYMALCKKHHLRILRNCARPSHSKPLQSRC